jgi:hypothetical protein
MVEAKKLSKKDAPSAEIGPSEVNQILFLGAAYERWVDNLFRISEGISQFAQDHIQRDIAAWKRFATCRDPSEFLECERIVAEETMSQFAEDILKVSRLFATVAGNNSLPPAQEQQKHASH